MALRAYALLGKNKTNKTKTTNKETNNKNNKKEESREYPHEYPPLASFFPN